MRFWNELFPEALAKFKSTVAEPKSQVNSKFSIRQENDWEAIFSKLEQSQSVYQEEAGGRRWFRKMRRKAADSVDVIAEGTRNLSMAIPDTVFSTPVVGVIQIILDVSIGVLVLWPSLRLNANRPPALLRTSGDKF